MSTPIQVQAAQRSLKLYKGIVGVGWDGTNIIVYVENEDVSIPIMIAGYNTVKKVSGKIGLLK